MERKGSNSRRERNLHFKTEDQNFPQFRMFRKIQRKGNLETCDDEIKLGVPFWVVFETFFEEIERKNEIFRFSEDEEIFDSVLFH
jgi:hypothetical protein